MQTSRRTSSPIQQQIIPPKQWRNPDKRNHHQSSNVLSSQSQTGSVIFKCQGSGIPPTNPIRNGTSSAKDTNPNGQHNSRRSDNNKIQPKCTKAMDMGFHWLRNREAQGQFKIYWQPRRTNLANYSTKHHPPAHHVNVRGKFLTRVKDLAEARHTKMERQTKTLSSKPAKLQGYGSLARLARLGDLA
jgi:hypothetical protein